MLERVAIVFVSFLTENLDFLSYDFQFSPKKKKKKRLSF